MKLHPVGVPKIMGTILGGPTITTITFLGLYWSSPYFGKLLSRDHESATLLSQCGSTLNPKPYLHKGELATCVGLCHSRGLFLGAVSYSCLKPGPQLGGVSG